MAELAKQIIRQQWPKRHHPDPLTRRQAVSLIKTHVHMLRQWQGGKAARRKNAGARSKAAAV